jgi:two-component system cell cycle response regulator
MGMRTWLHTRGRADSARRQHGNAERDLRFVGIGLRMPERLIRLSIAAMVPTFGVIAAVMLFSGEGPTGPVSRWVWIVVIASTVPAGALVARANLTPIWWARRSRPWDVNHLFVLYGDVGVSAVLFTFSRPEAGLFGSLLFAILSVYAAYFCSPVFRNLHIGITTAVITALSVITWRTGDFTFLSVLGRYLVAVAVVNGTVLLQSIFALGVRKAIRSTLMHAHQDSLTQLWNRRGFTFWAMAMVENGNGPVGMMFVDVDDYKSINDHHGHHVGDDVLKLAARRLADAVGSHGVLGRTGGDEFAVATELALPDLIRLAEAIRAAVHHADDAVPVTASIGVAAGPRGSARRRGGAPEQIISTTLHAADTALYRAKEAGRNCVAYVDLDAEDQRARVKE